MYKIYILHEDLFNTIDVFTNKDARHYVQYKIEWEDSLKVIHWTLESLVWKYPYWKETMTVTLFEKEIQLF